MTLVMFGAPKPEPAGWGCNHTDCNCARFFGATELDLLDVLINIEGLEQTDACRLLWDRSAVQLAGLQARMLVRASMLAAFPWLRLESLA